MTEEEIREKDWQILTAYSEITTLSYLQSIFENQAFIIANISNRPIKDVLNEMDSNRKENYNSIVKQVRENIPNYK